METRLVKGSKGNYDWEADIDYRNNFLRIAQDQGAPNGLQVVLLSPKQVKAIREITEPRSK